ncbi:FAD-dependent oxidoreductase [Candidatus Dependentiae bacterium]|nr:FAD-dependent oxidoreductase [Candidatus Dependentiae bacterium]
MSLVRSRIISILAVGLAVACATIFIWQRQQCTGPYSLCDSAKKENLVPVAIIGGGPAGLSASVYTARAQFRTVVFGGMEPGGELTGVKLIENWPGREGSTGAQLIDDLTKQAKHFGAMLVNQAITKVDFSQWPFVLTLDDGTIIHALAVIIASGGIARRLDIPGVEKYWGKGVGSCTICEAPFYKDKDVAVVGGGDTSGERALQLAAYAKNVYLIVRESRLQACATVQDYLKKAKNIHIYVNTKLEQISGDDDAVTSMVIREGKNETQQIPINGLYFAIGYIPNSALFKTKLAVDNQGFIKVEPQTQKTTMPGIFAAGNVAASDKEYGKASVASGSGVKAGMDTISFLEKIGFTQEQAEKTAPRFYQPPTMNDENTPNKKSVLSDYYAIESGQN